MSQEFPIEVPKSSRRSLFRQMLGGSIAGFGVWSWRGSNALGWFTDAPEPNRQLIIRNLVPLDAETPLTSLGNWITPNDLFFKRSHFVEPAILPETWRLSIGGLVDRPIVLSLEDLAAMDQITRPAVLQCAGNGRDLFRPNIPGIPWTKGAVGNAEWTGVRLVDLLDAVGVQAGAKHVQLLGADLPPHPKTPPFFRSIPLAKAIDPKTILATHMNGEPLPSLHGGPLRLIVPCWTANHSIKWLRELTVADEEAPGFYQQTGYRIPLEQAPPGSFLEETGGELVPVTAMNVKSLITHPGEGQRLPEGPIEVTGVAWTGTGHVTEVQVSIDDQTWEPATLSGPDVEGSWRTWHFRWDAAEGSHTIRARATDSHGETQPEQSPWNRSGYLWNAIEAVDVEVG